MKRMRLGVCLLLLGLLGGCKRNLVYSDYREIDQLELVQALGVDADRGLVTATASTAAMDAPIVLKNTSVSVSRAMREMQDYTAKKYLFYGHTRHLLVGEAAARENMSFYMEYMERGTEMRLDTRLYIVQGGTAENAISACGRQGEGITPLLDSLEKDVQLMGESHVFTCGEVAEMLAEDGCGLAAAVALVQEDNILEGDSTRTIASTGYAIFQNERLQGFLEPNLARGANLLLGQKSSDTLEVPDGEGGWAAVRLTNNRIRVQPIFAEGRLQSLRIRVKLTCNLDELQNPLDIYEPETIMLLEQGIEEMERYRMERVLQISQEMNADFCRLGKRARMRCPIRMDTMAQSWQDCFPALPMELEIDCRLLRTYDVGLSPIRSFLEHRG